MAGSAGDPLRPLDDAGGGAASLESIRALLAERLQARRSEIEEALVARADVGFDPAGRKDAEYVAGARAAVAEVVGCGLRSIEQDEGWLDLIPPGAAAQVRR